MAKSKVVTFTPKKSDPQDLHDFLNNQPNKAEAIRYVLKMYIKKYGTGNVQERIDNLLYGSTQQKEVEKPAEPPVLEQEAEEQPADKKTIVPSCYE